MYETHCPPDTEQRTKRLWHIRFSLPANEEKGRKWQTNGSLSVGADTLEDALAAARQKEPEATFWQINHGGVLHVVS